MSETPTVPGGNDRAPDDIYTGPRDGDPDVAVGQDPGLEDEEVADGDESLADPTVDDETAGDAP